MRIAFGTDDRTALTEAIVEQLRARGHDVDVLADGATPWPEVGRRVGEAVAAADAERGVVCCWTGTGVSIAANKVEGVRAALCSDAETAPGRAPLERRQRAGARAAAHDAGDGRGDARRVLGDRAGRRRPGLRPPPLRRRAASQR